MLLFRNAHLIDQMQVIMHVAQHEMPIFGNQHMGDHGLVAGQIFIGRGAERLRQGEVEGGWLRQKPQDLIEEETKAIVFRFKISVAEILSVTAEKIHVIIEFWFSQGNAPAKSESFAAF